MYCRTGSNACHQCNALFKFELNPTSGDCVCQSGYALDADGKCKTCSQFVSECATCSSKTTCTVCHLGYELGGPANCSAICGDGLLRGSEQCDDGNNVAGDGCSPGCQIEADYTCDIMVEPTQCSYALPLKITNYTVLKDPTQDYITFTLKLENWEHFKNLNFSEIISTNGSLSDSSYVLSEDGVLTITYKFSQNL